MRLGRAAVHILLLAFWGRTLPVQVNVTGQVPNTDVTYTYSVPRVTSITPAPTWQVCKLGTFLRGGGGTRATSPDASTSTNSLHIPSPLATGPR
jgi:hypothetical protein